MLVGKVTFCCNFFFLFLVHLVASYLVLNVEVNKEKIRYILQFVFHEGENTSRTAKIVNDVYDFDTAIANYVQFWFCRFGSGDLVQEILMLKMHFAQVGRTSKMSIKSEKSSKLNRS